MNLNNTTALIDTSKNLRGTYEIALTGIVLCIIMIMAIIGNILVVFAIYRQPVLRDNISSLFLVNLSLTDLSMAVVVMGTAVISLSMNWTSINQVWCDITCATNYCLLIVSMLTLSFIGVERYFAIEYPLRYENIINRKKVICLLIYSWIQGIAFALPPVVNKWNHYDYWEAVCAIEWSKKQVEIYVICACICCYLIPGIIMVFCYTKIIKEANKSPTNPAMDIPSQKKAKMRNKKLIFSLITVVSVYLVCLTPFCITKLLKAISIPVPGYMNLIAAFFGYLASASNPFIYGIFRREFRRAYKQILFHDRNKVRPSTNHLSGNSEAISGISMTKMRVRSIASEH